MSDGVSCMMAQAALDEGLVQQRQLQKLAGMQSGTGQRLGDLLMQFGYATQAQVDLLRTRLALKIGTRPRLTRKARIFSRQVIDLKLFAPGRLSAGHREWALQHAEGREVSLVQVLAELKLITRFQQMRLETQGRALLACVCGRHYQVDGYADGYRICCLECKKPLALAEPGASPSNVEELFFDRYRADELSRFGALVFTRGHCTREQLMEAARVQATERAEDHIGVVLEGLGHIDQALLDELQEEIRAADAAKENKRRAKMRKLGFGEIALKLGYCNIPLLRSALQSQMAARKNDPEGGAALLLGALMVDDRSLTRYQVLQILATQHKQIVACGRCELRYNVWVGVKRGSCQSCGGTLEDVGVDTELTIAFDFAAAEPLPALPKLRADPLPKLKRQTPLPEPLDDDVSPIPVLEPDSDLVVPATSERRGPTVAVPTPPPKLREGVVDDRPLEIVVPTPADEPDISPEDQVSRSAVFHSMGLVDKKKRGSDDTTMKVSPSTLERAHELAEVTEELSSGAALPTLSPEEAQAMLDAQAPTLENTLQQMSPKEAEAMLAPPETPPAAPSLQQMSPEEIQEMLGTAPAGDAPLEQMSPDEIQAMLGKAATADAPLEQMSPDEIQAMLGAAPAAEPAVEAAAPAAEAPSSSEPTDFNWLTASPPRHASGGTGKLIRREAAADDEPREFTSPDASWVGEMPALLDDGKLDFNDDIFVKFACIQCGKRIRQQVKSFDGRGCCPRCKAPVTRPEPLDPNVLELRCDCGTDVGDEISRCPGCGKHMYERFRRQKVIGAASTSGVGPAPFEEPAIPDLDDSLRGMDQSSLLRVIDLNDDSGVLDISSVREHFQALYAEIDAATTESQRMKSSTPPPPMPKVEKPPEDLPLIRFSSPQTEAIRARPTPDSGRSGWVPVLAVIALLGVVGTVVFGAKLLAPRPPRQPDEVAGSGSGSGSGSQRMPVKDIVVVSLATLADGDLIALEGQIPWGEKHVALKDKSRQGFALRDAENKIWWIVDPQGLSKYALADRLDEATKDKPFYVEVVGVLHKSGDGGLAPSKMMDAPRATIVLSSAWTRKASLGGLGLRLLKKK